MPLFRSAHSIPVPTVVIAGLLVGALSSPAFAAGSGYGVVPPGPTHPPGFSGVVSAKTFGKAGGHFDVHYFRVALLDLLVPKGHFIRPLEVVFSTGHSPTVSTYLSGTVRGYTSVLSFGLSFQFQSASVLLGRPILLTITDPEMKKGDILTEYVDGHFVKVANVTNNGALTLYVRGPEEYAIVALPRRSDNRASFRARWLEGHAG